MTVLGKGRAAAITDADIARLADSLSCHPADLGAIAQVESNGFGWFPDGRLKILFEKHWFYKYLEGKTRDNAVKSGLARKTWISPAKGGYKDQASADDRYKLLERAIRIDREAAFKSISMGTFQIMGFNHSICGHQTAEGMFNAFCDSEVYQLSAFAGFLKSKGLVPAVQSRDFARVETVYNGGGLNGAYAKKMRTASDKLRATTWAGYKPGSYPAVPVPTPKPVVAPPAPPVAESKPISPPATIERQPSNGNWLATLLSALLAALKGNKA